MRFKNMIARETLIFLILLSALMPYRTANAIPVIIYNDLEKESEGRLVEVEEVETTEVKKIRYRLRIYPSQEKEIARGSVLRFSLSRVFPAHKVKYEVKCPKKGDSIRITIKEIHENRMGGNCKLARYGHWSRRTGSEWTEVGSNKDADKSPTVADSATQPDERW